MAKSLVIFDFDCTIVDVDSDPWVAEQLGAAEAMETLRSQMPWNDMMEALMGVLHEQGNSLADIREALCSIPLQPEKISAIKRAHALGCELHIVSDANAFFIKTILDKYDITRLFTNIHTNPSHVDEDGRLHIGPFHSKSQVPHGCPLCPPNMCKGRIIDEIQQALAQEPRRIIYIGDGCGDYCPSLRLEVGDCVLPREGYPLLDLLTQDTAIVRANVYPWRTSKSLEEKLISLLEEEHRLGVTCPANCSRCAPSVVDKAEAVLLKPIKV